MTEITSPPASAQAPSIPVQDPQFQSPALADAVSPETLELAVVVPTYNERDNISLLLERLAAALTGVRYEVIIVDDDSPDGTYAVARELALHQHNVRLIRRIGRRGLASACLEGMFSTAAPYIAVIDGDLQHDERVLPRMLAAAREDQLDVVVASRNVEGASMGEFSRRRVRLSNLGQYLSKLILRTELRDPMSGFFLLDRRFLEEVIYRSSSVGFKILVDLLASARRPVKLVEVPYEFRVRESGESKLDVTVGLEYLYLVLDKLAGDYVPLRFVLYALVGAAGVLLHLSALWLFYRHGGISFGSAQIAATVIAMTFNFLLNNFVTYRDVQLRGKQLPLGLLTFYLACAIGAAINLSVARDLLDHGVPWLLSGIAGLAISSVWNYGVTSVTTWRRRRRRN